MGSSGLPTPLHVAAAHGAKGLRTFQSSLYLAFAAATWYVCGSHLFCDMVTSVSGLMLLRATWRVPRTKARPAVLHERSCCSRLPRLGVRCRRRCTPRALRTHELEPACTRSVRCIAHYRFIARRRDTRSSQTTRVRRADVCRAASFESLAADESASRFAASGLCLYRSTPGACSPT